MWRLIWILLALPVLLVAAAFIGPSLIDWTEHRQRIEAAVAEVSGLSLKVEGGISLRLLPEPSLRLQEVVWSDPGGAIAKVPQIDARLKLGALLQGEARVAALSLIAPELEPGREAVFLRGADSLLSGALLDRLEEIEVAAAAWHFANERRLVVDRLTIARSLRAGIASYHFDLIGEAWLRPLTASGRLHGFGNCEGPLAVEAALEGVLRQSSFSGKWHCGEGGPEISGLLSAEGSDFAALLALAGPESQGEGAQPLGFSLDGPLVWDSGNFDTPALSLGLGQQEAELRLGYRPQEEVALTGELRMPLLDLDRKENGGLLAVAGQAKRLFTQAVGAVSLDLIVDNWRFRGASGGRSRATLEFAQGLGRLSDLQLDLPNASSLALAGSLALDASDRSEGRLELVSEDLRGLLTWLGVSAEILPKERLRRLSLMGLLSGQAEAFHLEELQLRLDALEAGGKAQWRGRGSGELPALTLTLGFGALNLDAYGGLVLSRLVEEVTEAANLALSLSAETVTLAGESAENLVLTGTAVERAVQLETLSLERLFGGRLQAIGGISFATQELSVDLKLAGAVADLRQLPSELQISRDASQESYVLEVTLEGALDAPALAGQLEALGGAFVFSGLWSSDVATRGDWAVSLQHGDLTKLLTWLKLPFGLAEGSPRAIDLAGLFTFGDPWTLKDIAGQMGPFRLSQGQFSPAKRIDKDAPAPWSSLSLSIASLDTRFWRWQGDSTEGWAQVGLAFATEHRPLAGRLLIKADQVLGKGWRIDGFEALADSAGNEQGSLLLRGRVGEGRFETELVRQGPHANLHVTAAELPLAPFLPPLPGVAQPEGEIGGEAKLSWRVGGLAPLLQSLSGELTASGRARLALEDGIDRNTPPARLGQRILQAFVGDAASGLARIANLTAGLVRLLQRIAGEDFALSLALSAEEGRIAIGAAELRAEGILASAEGWVDLAKWQLDTSWSLLFPEQGGEPYYRERRSGPLGAADVLRDGLLFRGATPPG